MDCNSCNSPYCSCTLQYLEGDRVKIIYKTYQEYDTPLYILRLRLQYVKRNEIRKENKCGSWFAYQDNQVTLSLNMHLIY